VCSTSCKWILSVFAESVSLIKCASILCYNAVLLCCRAECFEVAVCASPLFQPWVEVTHQCWTQQVINLKTTNSWLFVKKFTVSSWSFDSYCKFIGDCWRAGGSDRLQITGNWSIIDYGRECDWLRTYFVHIAHNSIIMMMIIRSSDIIICLSNCLICCSAIMHKSLHYDQECGRKWQAEMRLKSLSVGKCMLHGCDSWEWM